MTSPAGGPLPLALDAMGGDHAPLQIVRGGLEYSRSSGRTVLLVGRPEQVASALRHSAQWTRGATWEVVPASDVIEFDEKITSIRNKKNSSIHVGTRLVRDGRAAAFVSAGHTGAVMALSKVIFGLIEGVDRPALPAPLPRVGGGYTVLLDAGANVDCRPEHFRQFAVMGDIYSRRVLGVARPRVALLSIGEEDSKGNEILLEVTQTLRETPIYFIGNVEGNDLFRDRADVVVCDGFVGNVALKVAEGIAEAIRAMLKQEIAGTPAGWLAALPMFFVQRPLKKKTDYAEVGGVPLLGLRHVSIVAHGRSSPKAIMNALRAGEAAATAGIATKIAEEIAGLHAAERRLAERTMP